MFVLLGGVGFDINCGVRLLRTNLDEKDVQPVKEQLVQVSVFLPTVTPSVQVCTCKSAPASQKLCSHAYSRLQNKLSHPAKKFELLQLQLTHFLKMCKLLPIQEKEKCM